MAHTVRGTADSVNDVVEANALLHGQETQAWGHTGYRVSRPTVSLWRKRFAQQGIAGLHSELKPGQPRSIGEEEIAKLINTALTSKPAGKTHWSRRSLADGTGPSESTVHRYR